MAIIFCHLTQVWFLSPSLPPPHPPLFLCPNKNDRNSYFNVMASRCTAYKPQGNDRGIMVVMKKQTIDFNMQE